MPVIPGIQEGQVLNAGSPVPIASPEEARLGGTALARAGEGMFALGDALDTAAAREKAKKDTLSSQLAENEAYKIILEEKAAAQQAAPIEGDATGFGQARGLYDRTQPRIAEVADKMISDPETRRMFMSEIGKEVNRAATEVYANEIVKRKNQNNVMQDKVISDYGQMARMQPQQLDFMLSKAEESVRKNPDIQPAVVEEAVFKAKEKVLLAAVNGLSADKKYDTAEVTLERYSGGILTPEDKDKLLDKIRADKDKDVNRDIQELTRSEKRMEKNRREVEDRLMNTYGAALNLAGVNETRRAPILLQIGNDVAAGRISEEKARALMGSKVFYAPTDDLYDSSIMNQLFKDDDYAKAIDKVYADRGIKVSPERASDMINRINSLEAHKRSDPNFNALLKAGEKKIRDQAADTILAPLDNATKRELLTKVNKTVEEYYKRIAQNPKVDTAALSDSLISTNLGFRTNFLKGQENFMSYNSADGINREKTRIIKDALDKKQRGLLTPAEEKKVKQNLQLLENRLQQIKPLDGAAPTAAPSGAARSAPVRGK